MINNTPITQINLQQHSLEPAAETKVTNMINAILFFLQHVLIINIDDDYRLLVIKKNRVLLDKKYKSIKGARIAFSKLFLEMGWKQGVKPKWSHMYPPDEDWLMDLLNLSHNGN